MLEIGVWAPGGFSIRGAESRDRRFRESHRDMQFLIRLWSTKVRCWSNHPTPDPAHDLGGEKIIFF